MGIMGRIMETTTMGYMSLLSLSSITIFLALPKRRYTTKGNSLPSH